MLFNNQWTWTLKVIGCIKQAGVLPVFFFTPHLTKSINPVVCTWEAYLLSLSLPAPNVGWSECWMPPNARGSPPWSRTKFRHRIIRRNIRAKLAKNYCEPEYFPEHFVERFETINTCISMNIFATTSFIVVLMRSWQKIIWAHVYETPLFWRFRGIDEAGETSIEILGRSLQ